MAPLQVSKRFIKRQELFQNRDAIFKTETKPPLSVEFVERKIKAFKEKIVQVVEQVRDEFELVKDQT